MDRLQHYYSPRRRVPVSVASLGRGQTSTVVLRSRGSAQAHTKTLGAARSRLAARRRPAQRAARRCRDPRASGAGKRRFCPRPDCCHTETLINKTAHKTQAGVGHGEDATPWFFIIRILDYNKFSSLVRVNNNIITKIFSFIFILYCY